MSRTETQATDRPASFTPTERFLTAALLFAPLLYLAADSMYAATTWHNATAGVLHVIAATAYGFVVWRIATWMPRESLLGLAIIITGVIGLAGNVAYGFDTIHMSLGDTALVDQHDNHPDAVSARRLYGRHDGELGGLPARLRRAV